MGARAAREQLTAVGAIESRKERPHVVNTPEDTNDLPDLWEELGSGTPPVLREDEAERFYATLGAAIAKWLEEERETEPSKRDRSGGLSKLPRALLVRALRQLRDGAERNEYWVIHATPESVAGDPPSPGTKKFVFGEWAQRLSKDDSPARTVPYRDRKAQVRIVAWSRGAQRATGRAITALLIANQKLVLPPKADIRYVTLASDRTDPAPPLSLYALGIEHLIQLARRDGQHELADDLEQVRVKRGIPSVKTAYVRFMAIARRLRMKKVRRGTVVILADDVRATRTATVTLPASDGPLALAGGGDNTPTLGTILADLADEAQREAAEAVDRLWAIMDGCAPFERLQAQQAEFDRLFAQAETVIPPVLDELARAGTGMHVETWVTNARNEWFAQELERDQAADRGHGTRPEVERAVRRSKTPRTQSMLEREARLAVRRAASEGIAGPLRRDLEAWLRMLNHRLLDTSIEARVEQELFVRVKLWKAWLRTHTADDAVVALPTNTREPRTIPEYITQHEGKLLSTLYRVRHLIRVSPVVVRISKRWIRARRQAPIVEKGEEAGAHHVLAEIFEEAQKVAANRYIEDRDLLALQRFTEDLLSLRERFAPLPYDAQVRLAQELRTITYVFNFALFNLHEWANPGLADELGFDPSDS